MGAYLGRPWALDERRVKHLLPAMQTLHVRARWDVLGNLLPVARAHLRHGRRERRVLGENQRFANRSKRIESCSKWRNKGAKDARGTSESLRKHGQERASRTSAAVHVPLTFFNGCVYMQRPA